MNSEKAIEKITTEFNTKKPSGRIQQAIAQFVSEIICDFCNESDDFSAAVLAEGNTLNGCLDSIASGVHSSISDIDVARKAVRYFVPDADVRSSYSVVMPGTKQPEASSAKILNIFDILG